ncbi:hypothetical protein [Micromonospora sp. NPDC000442]|uniref:hypothetical protein n=1 Tax=Micromonospora sp. NPDC000442 TaxID=3364217 RepID=UPI0036BA5F74
MPKALAGLRFHGLVDRLAEGQFGHADGTGRRPAALQTGPDTPPVSGPVFALPAGRQHSAPAASTPPRSAASTPPRLDEDPTRPRARRPRSTAVSRIGGVRLDPPE